MEITYTDAEGNETRIVPVRVEKDPLVYFVPSTLSFEGSFKKSNATVDYYSHHCGGHLHVERYFFQIEGDGSQDGYSMLAERAEEIATCTVKPARLQSGFSMITYEEPSSEGEELVRLCCELCIVKEDLIAVVLFLSTVHLDDLNHTDVFLHKRIVRQFAKMTEWE